MGSDGLVLIAFSPPSIDVPRISLGAVWLAIENFCPPMMIVAWPDCTTIRSACFLVPIPPGHCWIRRRVFQEKVVSPVPQGLAGEARFFIALCRVCFVRRKLPCGPVFVACGRCRSRDEYRNQDHKCVFFHFWGVALPDQAIGGHDLRY